jgi:hypothetical protein
MVKAFYGTSENAVNSQIWIAISVYVLVAAVLSITPFEKMPILQALQAANFLK